METEILASTILGAFEEARSQLIGKSVVLTDGKAGTVTARGAYRYAAEKGYDLGDYADGEIVSDWWGFVWMILAEVRGLLTPEQRALAWKKHDERLLTREKVVGVIRNDCFGP